MFQPITRRGDDLVGFLLTTRSQLTVVVDIEALVQSEARMDRIPADERRRLITALLEHLGQRFELLQQLVASVVLDAVIERGGSRENGSVRR